MTTLLNIRGKIISVYARYETYIRMAARFVVILFAVITLNGLVGYQETLAGTMPTIMISLICTLIPVNAAIAILAVITLVHLYSLALEAAIVGGLLLLVLLLLYFRFSPRDSMLLLLYPLCRALGITYALPVAGGLLYSPGSGVSVAVGIAVDSFLRFIHDNETAIRTAAQGTDTDGMITNFQFLIDGIVQDHGMIIRMIAAIAAAVLVYLVRRLPVRYAWIIASGAGAVIQLIVLLAGALIYDTDISVGTSFFGVIIAFLIGMVISFFGFNLDYSRVENTQFEDDHYYYYVKAIPKNVVSNPKRTVKTISSQRSDREYDRGRENSYYRNYRDGRTADSYDAVPSEDRSYDTDYPQTEYDNDRYADSPSGGGYDPYDGDRNEGDYRDTEGDRYRENDRNSY